MTTQRRHAACSSSASPSAALAAAGCGGDDDEAQRPRRPTTTETDTTTDASGTTLNGSVGPGFEISLTTETADVRRSGRELHDRGRRPVRHPQLPSDGPRRRRGDRGRRRGHESFDGRARGRDLHVPVCDPHASADERGLRGLGLAERSLVAQVTSTVSAERWSASIARAWPTASSRPSRSGASPRDRVGSGSRARAGTSRRGRARCARRSPSRRSSITGSSAVPRDRRGRAIPRCRSPRARRARGGTCRSRRARATSPGKRIAPGEDPVGPGRARCSA